MGSVANTAGGLRFTRVAIMTSLQLRKHNIHYKRDYTYDLYMHLFKL